MRGSAEGTTNRRLAMLFATAFVICGLAVPVLAAPESDAAYPSNFRRHQEQYWVWYAPASWIAASGKNDLHISSATGTLWNNYGASAVICPQTADQWFSYLRTNFRDTAGAGQGHCAATRSLRDITERVQDQGAGALLGGSGKLPDYKP